MLVGNLVFNWIFRLWDVLRDPVLNVREVTQEQMCSYKTHKDKL